MAETKAKKTPAKKQTIPKRSYNVRPDSLDFRDLMYVSTLVEVPSQIDLAEYKQWQVPILNQGQEGACTGFGLATVVHYLLRRRKVVPDPTEISPRMLYEMAKRYDEWAGEDYDGSSARGAMKGWHKHGVCTKELWTYSPTNVDRQLTDTRSRDAVKRPLGSYFRVNHQDLVAMHAAIAEVGILYATATVHAGWNQTTPEGSIPLTDEILGGHAFAIVAYDDRGFWIQNSWGNTWGLNGFACISYDDWLVNGNDIWVCRLGAAVNLTRNLPTAIGHSAAANNPLVLSFTDLRPHIISLGNDGRLKPGGDFGTSPEDKGKIASGNLKGLEGYNLPIESCTLWAPACTIDLFEQNYQPAIESGQIDRFTLFTLTDTAEQDDNCASIYNKSLLYQNFTENF